MILQGAKKVFPSSCVLLTTKARKKVNFKKQFILNKKINDKQNKLTILISQLKSFKFTPKKKKKTFKDINYLIFSNAIGDKSFSFTNKNANILFDATFFFTGLKTVFLKPRLF